MRRESERRLIMVDPNVRPDVIGDRAAYLARFESWLTYAHLVKLSARDAEWLYPRPRAGGVCAAPALAGRAARRRHARGRRARSPSRATGRRESRRRRWKSSTRSVRATHSAPVYCGRCGRVTRSTPRPSHTSRRRARDGAVVRVRGRGAPVLARRSRAADARRRRRVPRLPERERVGRDARAEAQLEQVVAELARARRACRAGRCATRTVRSGLPSTSTRTEPFPVSTR